MKNLNGSEKQIIWANELRNKMIAGFIANSEKTTSAAPEGEQKNAFLKLQLLYLNHILDQSEARFFIDNQGADTMKAAMEFIKAKYAAAATPADLLAKISESMADSRNIESAIETLINNFAAANASMAQQIESRGVENTIGNFMNGGKAILSLKNRLEAK